MSSGCDVSHRRPAALTLRWHVRSRADRASRIERRVSSRKHGSPAEARRHSSMNTTKLLVVAVLATSIGAPNAGFAGDTNVPQPIRSTELRVPFLHGLPFGRVGGQTELASLERANEWLNSPPLTAPALRGKVVLIDFWTYTCINWLRTASLCPRVGREIQGSRIGGDRRPCAGVRFREEHRQRSLGREGDADRLPGRSGQ